MGSRYHYKQYSYLVKFAGKSYRDVKWLSANSIDDFPVPPEIKQMNQIKINKYLESNPSPDNSQLSDFHPGSNIQESNPTNFFNPNYTIPEKIIFVHDISSSKLSDDSFSYYFSTKSFQKENEETYKYITRLIPNYNEKNRILVKWTDLDYSNLTWENKDTVLEYPQLITEYLTRVRSPNDVYLKDINIISNFEQSANIIRISSPDIHLCRYQLDTFNFLYEAWSNQKTSIIADDITYNEIDPILAFLSYFSYRKERPSFLLVLPVEVIDQWQNAINHKTSLTSLNLHQNVDTIEIMTKCEFEIPNTRISQYNCILTTHKMLIDHLKDFIRISWDIAIINERADPYTLDIKFFSLLPKLSISFLSLITIQLNQLDKASYFSILHLCEPLNYDEFKPTENDEFEFQQLDEEHRPLVISRSEENIYEIEELFLKCPMTTIQQRYLKELFTKNINFFCDNNHQQNFAEITNIILDILKICNHPFLLPGVKSLIYDEEKNSHQSAEDLSTSLQTELLLMSSGKFIILDKLLNKFYSAFLQSPNLLMNRICIFCQQIEVMNLIEELIQYRNYEYQRIDSSIRGQERQQRIDMFNSPTSHDFLFLTTTQSIELVLNNVASFIAFDSSLNPINDIAFVSHISAIKQDRIIYRFLIDCSLETCIQIYHNPTNKENFMNSKDNVHLIERNLRYSAFHAFEDKVQPDLNSIEINTFLQNSKSLHYDDNLNLIIENDPVKFMNQNNQTHYEFEESNTYDDELPTFGFNDFDNKSASPHVGNSGHKDIMNTLGITFTYSDKLNKSDFWESLKQTDFVEPEAKSEIQQSNENKAEIQQHGIKEVERHEVHLSEWNFEKLKSLENSLLTFGYGRWLQLSKKEKKPIKDIIIASNVILNDLLMSTKNSSPILETVYQFYKSVSYDIIHEDERLFTRIYGSLIRQMHQSISVIDYIQQLEEIYIINAVVGYDLFIRNSDQYPLIPLYKDILMNNHLESDVFPSDSEDLLQFIPLVSQTKPAPWWKATDDAVLVMHVYANGFPIQNGLRFSGSIVPPQSALTKRIKTVVNTLKSIYLAFAKKKKLLLFTNCEFDTNNPESLLAILLTYENLKDSFLALTDDEELRVIGIASKLGTVDKKRLFSNSNLNVIKHDSFRQFLKLVDSCAEGEFTKSNRNADFLFSYLSDSSMTREKLKSNLRNIILLKYISKINDFSPFSKNDIELLNFINRNGLSQLESDKHIVSRFHNANAVTKYLFRLLQVEDHYLHHQNSSQSEESDNSLDSNDELQTSGSGKTRQPLFVNNGGKGGKRPAKSSTRIQLNRYSVDADTDNDEYDERNHIEKTVSSSDNEYDLQHKQSEENSSSEYDQHSSDKDETYIDSEYDQPRVPQKKTDDELNDKDENEFPLPISSKNSSNYTKNETAKKSQKIGPSKGYTKKTAAKKIRIPTPSSSPMSSDSEDEFHDQAQDQLDMNDEITEKGITRELHENESKSEDESQNIEGDNHSMVKTVDPINQEDEINSEDEINHQNVTQQNEIDQNDETNQDDSINHQDEIKQQEESNHHDDIDQNDNITKQDDIDQQDDQNDLNQQDEIHNQDEIDPNENEEEDATNQDDEIDEKFLPTSELYQKRMKYINSQLPIQLNSTVRLISMGKVVINKPLFHSKRYIYCDGYTSEKLYISIKNPDEKTWYVSTISDDGGESPVYTVYLKDDPSISYTGNVPTKPWVSLLYDIEKAKNNGETPTRLISVSGPEFFGLSSPKAIKLMKMMPGAELLQDFAQKPIIPLDEDIEQEETDQPPSETSLPQSIEQKRAKDKLSIEQNDVKDKTSIEQNDVIDKPSIEPKRVKNKTSNEQKRAKNKTSNEQKRAKNKTSDIITQNVDSDDDLKSKKYQDGEQEINSLFHHSFGMIASSSNQSDFDDPPVNTVVKLKSLKAKTSPKPQKTFMQQAASNSHPTRYLYLDFTDLFNDHEVSNRFREEQDATFSFNRSLR